MKPFRTLIAPVVIAALAVTGVTAVEARAENNDLAKLLIGAVVVGAVVNAIDNNNKATVSQASDRSGYAGRVVEGSDRYGRDHGRQDYRRALNSECLATYRSRHGDRQLYDGWCLMRSNVKLHELPKSCAVRVVVRGGKNRVAYDPRCLTREGYWAWDQRRRDYRHGQYDGWVYDDRRGDHRDGHIDYGR